MTMEFKEYPDREMLALSLADQLSSQLAQHLRNNDGATLCVPALCVSALYAGAPRRMFCAAQFCAARQVARFSTLRVSALRAVPLCALLRCAWPHAALYTLLLCEPSHAHMSIS